MTETLSHAFLLAAARTTLLEIGASSDEVEAIIQTVGPPAVAREMIVWGNPTQWGQYHLTMLRLRLKSAAKDAERRTQTSFDS